MGLGLAVVLLWASVPLARTQGAALGIRRTLKGRDTFANPDPECLDDHCKTFKATVEKGANCRCQCRAEVPVFLHSRRVCANSTGECPLSVAFGASAVPPTVFLPIQNHILEPTSPLNWKGVGVSVQKNGTLPCIISNVGVLSINGWKLINRSLFGFATASSAVFLKWQGNGEAARFLAGKLVQVSLQCAATRTPCIFFRVIGSDEITSLTSGSLKGGDFLGHSVQKSGMGETGGGSDVGMIVGIICGSLLVLTLIGVVVFWLVCWKHQKDRLLRKVHMQYVYQQRMAAQQNAHLQQYSPGGTLMFDGHLVEMQPTSSHHTSPAGTPMSSDDEGYGSHLPLDVNGDWIDGRGPEHMDGPYMQQLPMPHQYQGEMGAEALPPPPPYPHIKKKLYFSAEFFEPENMVDPPPVAEEFLYEVRRMIDIAKGRIRARRYITNMFTIPEEASSHASSELNSERLRSLDEMESQGFRRANSDSPDSEPDSGKGKETSSEEDSKGSLEKDSGTGCSVKSSKSPSKPQEEKVSDWLSRLPPDGVAPATPPKKPSRHSRLFKNFAARQAKRSSGTGSPPEALEIVEMESVDAASVSHAQPSVHKAPEFRSQPPPPSPQFASRSRILNSHHSLEARGPPQPYYAQHIPVQSLGGQGPLSYASLPRQFMRTGGGRRVAPYGAERALSPPLRNSFTDSLPRAARPSGGSIPRARPLQPSNTPGLNKSIISVE